LSNVLLEAKGDPMVEIVELVTSALARGVSIVTAWLAFFHRGRVQMSVPSMVVFGYDAGGPGRFDPKVMVRCLLFSTGGTRSRYRNALCSAQERWR
jgi:hypothetical protein